MLHSVEKLCLKVLRPLSESHGPRTKILTIEVHGGEVRGLALCPGKIVKYVLEAQSNLLRTSDLLTLTRSKKN